MLKKGLENNYEDSNRCKHSKPAIDIFKAGRGRNTPKAIQMLLGAGKHTYYNSIHFKCIFGEYEAGT